ncbi:MAG: mechanosensitive ion channel domain-containing protein [Pseudomonadota bacterium]
MALARGFDRWLAAAGIAVFWLCAFAGADALGQAERQSDAAVDRARPAISAPAQAPTGDPAPTPAAEDGATVGAEPASEQATEGAADALTGLDQATLERAIEVLEDEQERQAVLDTLRAVAASEAAAPDTAEPLINGPMGWLRDQLDQRAQTLVDAMDGAVASLDNIGVFGDWLEQQVTSPLRREFWLRTLTNLGIIFGTSVPAAFMVLWLLRPARRLFETYAPPTPFHLIAATALHAVLRLVPVAVFAGTAIATGAVLDLGPFTQAVAVALVTGFAFVTAGTALLRAVLNYRNPHMRLVPLEPAAGAELQRGLVRVVAVGGYGYFGLEAARALGLPWTLHGFLLHLLFLATFLFYVRLVLRFRSRGVEGFHALAAAGAGGMLGQFLPWRTVARIWHWGAILFGLALYGAWALQVPGGPLFLLRSMVATLALLVAIRLINVWLTQRSDPGRGAEEAGDEFDAADAITSAARSPLTLVWQVVTTLLGLALIFQVWGGDVLGLLGSETGRAFRNALISSVAAITVAYVLWKVVNGWIRAAIDEKDALGRPVRSNRGRTLLTISRNLLFVLIWVTAILTGLSELGVNLAPLLAGAGVIGLAVGFGSQQLVKDIITGFFILIEDTVSVGDVAELAGRSGVVEAVTLRTVRLRAYDGIVHTIPYSSIDTIANFTKDFSYYVFDVGVAYSEDTDRVVEVMREIGAEMQRDRAFRRLILAPLDVAGVDRFADSAVIIKARIKTRPLQQWTVGREFNRRLKQRFDALGIEIPFPQRTLHVVDPRAKSATPAEGGAIG